MKRVKHNKSAGFLKLKKNKGISSTRKSLVSEALEAELNHFREFHPAHRLSKNLRTMLIEFLMYEGATEASYLQDLLYDLQGLFNLLETMQLDEGEEKLRT